eukprot:481636_1
MTSIVESKNDALDNPDIINCMWTGAVITDDGKTLGNCMLGINRLNKRFVTVAEKPVLDALEQARKEYNKVLLLLNSDNKAIYHILRKKPDEEIGRVKFTSGLWWRYFDEFRYEDRNIICDFDDFKNLIYKADDGKIAAYKKTDGKNITKEIQNLLKKNFTDFPVSFLSQLAKKKTRDTKTKIDWELRCKGACGPCRMESELTVQKAPLENKKKRIFAAVRFYSRPIKIETKENDELEIVHDLKSIMCCIHPNSIQRQSLTAVSEEMDSDDFEKIGKTKSPQLMFQTFVKGGDISQIAAGIDMTGIYNVRHIQNLETKLQDKKYGYKEGKLTALCEAAQKSYEADLEFNNEKKNTKNAFYYGGIHHLNFLFPLFIMLYSYVGFWLFEAFVIDVFMDFTESLILAWLGFKVLNFIVSICSPLGGLFPIPLFEVITQSPTGQTVADSWRHFLFGYKMYLGKPLKRTIYIHSDRFRGFLYGCYNGFGHEGHHYNYLLDCIKFLQTMNNVYLSKYLFRLYFGEVHSMLALGKHTKNMPKTWSKHQTYNYLGIRMDLHRYAIYSLNVQKALGNINLFKYISTKNTIDYSKSCQNFDYVTLQSMYDDIARLVKKGDLRDAYIPREAKNVAHTSKEINEVKDFYNWEEEKIVDEKAQIKTSKFDEFLNDDSIESMQDGIYVYYRPLPDYKWLYGVVNTETCTCTYYPSMNSPMVSKGRRKGTLKNEINCPGEWSYYNDEFVKLFTLETHMLNGGSTHRNNVFSELTNRWKKNQEGHRTAIEVVKYCVETTYNRLVLRQSWFLQFQDQTARQNLKIFKDSTDLDGIYHKGQDRIDSDSPLYAVHEDLVSFSNYLNVKQYSHIHRQLCRLFKEDNYGVTEAAPLFKNSENKTYRAVVSALTQGFKPAKNREKDAMLLGNWLEGWKRDVGLDKQNDSNKN